MKVLSTNEVEKHFGLSAERIDELERDAANGMLHGTPVGEITRGRPFMFGEEMRQVGFKEPLQKVAAIDRRAEQLGMQRSEYLRSVVDADLELAALSSTVNDESGTNAVTAKTLRGKRAASFIERWKRRAVLKTDKDNILGPLSEPRGDKHAHSA